jgi:UDP-N-acetylglucosamine--N-acetylmuramyl-(pentapeptide) pyrophosphoryl-undecaprenol N-acetylglucosamine transferase
MKILPKLLEGMQVIHLAGHLDWKQIDANAQTLSPAQARRYQAFPYLHEMGAALAAADLIVSRAGASVLGEYPLFGLPAILVPYPYAWRYQQVNATFLVERGAAVILPDDDLERGLYDQINSLIADPARLSSMSLSMASLSTPDAAQKIAELIYEMSGVVDGGIPT